MEGLLFPEDGSLVVKCSNAYDPYELIDTFAASPAAETEYALDRDTAEAQCEDLGLVFLDANDHTLQLDFDDEKSYQDFFEFRLHRFVQLDEASGAFNIKRITVTESKSGNKHVHIQVYRKFTQIERIALQAILGSDPMREMFNLLRASCGEERAIRLFEKPDATQIVLFARDEYQPQLTAGEQPVALIESSFTDEPTDLSNEFELI